jgi:hypothetical protein
MLSLSVAFPSSQFLVFNRKFEIYDMGQLISLVGNCSFVTSKTGRLLHTDMLTLGWKEMDSSRDLSSQMNYELTVES